MITTDSINGVEANAGSTFKTMRKMKVHQFEGIGNAGAVFKIDGDFANLNLDFNAGSVGDFSGQCKNLGIRSNAGAVVNASNLVADKGNVSSNAGSVITINVTGELSVDATSGSVIKNLGNPQLKGSSYFRFLRELILASSYRAEFLRSAARERSLRHPISTATA